MIRTGCATVADRTIAVVGMVGALDVAAIRAAVGAEGMAVVDCPLGDVLRMEQRQRFWDDSVRWSLVRLGGDRYVLVAAAAVDEDAMGRRLVDLERAYREQVGVAPKVDAWRGGGGTNLSVPAAEREDTVDFLLSPVVTRGVRAMGGSDALRAALMVVLARLRGDRDVTVGARVDGALVALRVDVGEAASFAELVDIVVRCGKGAADRAGEPVEGVVLRHIERPSLDLPGVVTRVEVCPAAWADLTFDVVDDGLGMRGVLRFRGDAVDRAAARALAERFVLVLTALVAEPHRALADVDILLPGERAILAARWNGPTRALPALTVSAMVTAQAARTPDAIAVVAGESVTYAEFQRRVEWAAAGAPFESGGAVDAVVRAHAAGGGSAERVLWLQERFRLAPGERVLCEVADTFWPLAVGATAVVGGDARTAYLSLDGVRAHASPSLDRVICQGGPVSVDVVRLAPRAEFHVVDWTVGTTWQAKASGTGLVPYGRPLWNRGVRVLDPLMRPVPPGVVGDLYVTGCADADIADPLGGADGRMRWTGRRATWTADGVVEPAGRDVS